MMDKQQWTVLPASMVKHIKGLRLSPLGLVPQCNWRDRMISDYSYFGVNGDTLQLATLDAMQFGRTLHRLLAKIHRANDIFRPVHLSKIDLADGFYRLWLRPEDTFRLAVLSHLVQASRSWRAFHSQILWAGLHPRQIFVHALKPWLTSPTTHCRFLLQNYWPERPLTSLTLSPKLPLLLSPLPRLLILKPLLSLPDPRPTDLNFPSATGTFILTIFVDWPRETNGPSARSNAFCSRLWIKYFGLSILLTSWRAQNLHPLPNSKRVTLRGLPQK